MRQRWRQPVLLAGLVVAVLLALRAVAPLVGPAPAARPAEAPAPARAAAAAWLEAPTGAELLLGVEDGLLRVDVDARDVRAVRLPGAALGMDDGLVPRGEVVVAVRGGSAYAARTRFGAAGAGGAGSWPDGTGPVGRAGAVGPVTWLGSASYALASAHPGRVWLVEQTGDPDRWFRVREVALPGPSGAARARALATGTLPLGRRPVAAVPGGLLAADVGPGGGLAVWDPRTGRASLWLAADSPRVVAASGRLVAWVEGSSLHLGDLATGRDRIVPPPPATDGFAPAGAFSPDGRLLAAVTRAGFSTRPALALVRVDRAAATRVAGSEGTLADRCSPCLAWTSAGDWVFFNRLGPRLAIGAYQLGRPRAASVRLDVPGSYPPSFAVL